MSETQNVAITNLKNTTKSSKIDVPKVRRSSIDEKCKVCWKVDKGKSVKSERKSRH